MCQKSQSRLLLVHTLPAPKKTKKFTLEPWVSSGPHASALAEATECPAEDMLLSAQTCAHKSLSSHGLANAVLQIFFWKAKPNKPDFRNGFAQGSSFNPPWWLPSKLLLCVRRHHGRWGQGSMTCVFMHPQVSLSVLESLGAAGFNRPRRLELKPYIYLLWDKL